MHRVYAPHFDGTIPSWFFECSCGFKTPQTDGTLESAAKEMDIHLHGKPCANGESYWKDME